MMTWCFLFITIFGYGAALQYLDLTTSHADTWIVQNDNNTVKVFAAVPGGIFSDLKNDFLKQDIYYRFNDEVYRWVAYDNWTYSRNFSVPEDYTSERKETVVFHGVDTVADITMNGVQIGSRLDNMFVRHVLDVKNILKYDGLNNLLTVRLVSPVLAAKERSLEWPRVVPDCVPSSYHGECHANLIRKTQSSFAWDWGPAFPTSGIWRNVELLTYNVAILRDITVHLQRDSDPQVGVFWYATFALHLEAVGPGELVDGIARVELLIDGTPQGRIRGMKEVNSKAADENGELLVEVKLEVLENQISLWWPNGMGSQTLYKAIATFQTTNSGFSGELTAREVKIGFRTIELVQDRIGDNGLSFYLKINGVPFFAKGSNWIPPHVLPERTSAGNNGRDMTADLLLSAREIGTNMLRVWGGGNYESDYFYNLADQYGILIWQDMMFACSMYPVQPDFLSSVELEVKQQVRRLQHHPSIAIWAGNNENEAALRQNWYGTAPNFSSYLRDYSLLYGNVIRNAVLLNDPSSIFLISSPSNGLETLSEEGFVAKNPQSTLYGDIHYYNYLADGWNPSIYPLPRFASEYGFQSLPSMETLRSAGASADDWGTKKQLFISRQHHVGGYQEMAIEIQRHLTMPPTTESEEGMAKFIYLTQVNQAMGLKTETEAYRRGKGILRPATNGSLEGNTMGALYWQLNDIWQAPTWSTLEHGGKWKMAHYFAAKFFSHLLASPLVTAYNELQVHLLTDRPYPDIKYHCSHCILTIRVYHWNNPCPIKILEVNTTTNPITDKGMFFADLNEFLNSSGCNGSSLISMKSSCFLTFDLVDYDENREAPTNLLLLASPKDAVGLQRANVTVTHVGELFPTQDTLLKEHYPYSVQINISSDGVALFVWLEAEGVKGRFSDNGFLMAATEEEEICRTNSLFEGPFIGNGYSSDLLGSGILVKTPVKRKVDSGPHVDCPFDCSELDNSIAMAVCCLHPTWKDNISLPKMFIRTVHFYLKENITDSSYLRNIFTVTHLLD